MKNFVQDGDVLELTAPFNVVAGQCIANGRMFGVAIHDAPNTTPVQCRMAGVFELWKSNPATAFAKGQLVYLITAAATVTDVNGGGANIIVGAATEASAGGAATVKVRLNQAAQLA
jgi:predicted RecA/RadA family phage recombinase